jgi:CRP/FNR family cyclic AMP-dependent transcriptional regulator
MHQMTVSSEEFLQRLNETESAALRSGARPRRWPQGTSIFNEGDRSEWVAIVLEGRTKISHYTDRGDEVVLAVRGPGCLLGELSAIGDEPRSATVTALEVTDGLVIPAETFRSFLEQHPRVALLLVQMLSRRLREADRKRIEYSAFDTLGRISRRLVELADAYGEPSDEGLRIDLSLTQEELAGLTGSSREAVSKALRTLRGRGWISTHRRAITVRDIDALRRRAE